MLPRGTCRGDLVEGSHDCGRGVDAVLEEVYYGWVTIWTRDSVCGLGISQPYDQPSFG